MTVRETIEAQAAKSVGAMLRRRVRLTPDREAFRYPDAKETWHTMSWAQTGAKIDILAAGLLSFGLKQEQRVAIASSTRIEWILADFAINTAGLAATTVYPNTNDEDVAYILSDSGTVVLFAENAEQLEKVTKHPELDDQVRYVVLFDGASQGERVLSWDEFQARGKDYLAENPTCVDDAIEATGPDTLSTLIYTSGTTGKPKGAELLHSSWTYLGASIETIGFTEIDDVHYLWLPLSHVFGKCLLAIQVWSGFTTAVDGRLDKIVPNLAVIRPTLMCGAPRIFEKVRAAVLTGATSKGAKGAISRWAFSVGLKSNPYRLKGEKLPPVLAAQYAVADKLVFSKLRERLGGNMKFMVSGSAKLSRQVQEWFYAAGLLIVEGYGLTETSAVAFVNHWSVPRFGTVGPVTPGIERRIAEDGEVLIRGPIVMRGYHNKPEETAAAIVDGWFHTGDIGELDADGYLKITDRKKDLMKTSGGKYVAPQKVEGVLVANIPYVTQAVAVGDGQKYIGALLVLDPDNLKKWGENHGHADASYAELSQMPQIRASIDRFMERANAKLERWETVKKYAILDRELTVDDGDVTPNMKIRRKAVVAANQALVDSLFEGDAE
ncbi:MAG TPA: long-chain fatty acid--CoA ligase [Propionibacteriaceae bacterium]|nr:long-chain fatty acid--CoA ligase [Propionibacteriaceae bacterium]